MTDVIIGGQVPPGFQAVPKVNEDGNQLYVLPQPDIEISYTIPRLVKSVDVSDRPAMTTKRVPLMDENDTQKSYEVTQTESITEIQEQEDGSEVEVVTGYRQVGTGQFLLLYTTQEEQEVDEDGNLLYWNSVEDPAIRYEPQSSIEILADDERWTEELQLAYDLIPIPEETPQQPLLSPLEQRLAALENSQKEVKQTVQNIGTKVDSTSTDLGGFMDFYFSQ